MKPLTLDGLLMLEEAEIKSLFPFGAVVNKSGKWRACEEGQEATKGLDELLKDKKERRHKTRLLGKVSGYTEVAAFSLHTIPDPGEAVDEMSQRQMAAESMERFNMTLEVQQKAERILYLRRRLEKKQVRSVRKAA